MAYSKIIDIIVFYIIGNEKKGIIIRIVLIFSRNIKINLETHLKTFIYNYKNYIRITKEIFEIKRLESYD